MSPQALKFLYGPYSQVAFVDEAYLLSLYGDSTGHFSKGLGGSVIVPWEGFAVSRNEVQVEVYLDLNGIVEIYDNNTPGDLSDDHVVLSNRYWERFSINVVQN